MTGADPGGNWSGTGIVSSNLFDPSIAGVGTHTISYSFSGACGNSDSTSVEVLAASNATISPVGPLCVGDAPITLNAIDSGGVWTGTGVSGNSFDPNAAGAGYHVVYYTISGICGDMDSITINVEFCTGMNTNGSEHALQVFPNPASQSVRLLYDSDHISGFAVQLLDNLGKIVLTESTNSSTAVLDISNLSSGVYFIKVSESNNLIMKKLIIN